MNNKRLTDTEILGYYNNWTDLKQVTYSPDEEGDFSCTLTNQLHFHGYGKTKVEAIRNAMISFCDISDSGNKLKELLTSGKIDRNIAEVKI